jgi:hypothetical protein
VSPYLNFDEDRAYRIDRQLATARASYERARMGRGYKFEIPASARAASTGVLRAPVDGTHVDASEEVRDAA